MGSISPLQFSPRIALRKLEAMSELTPSEREAFLRVFEKPRIVKAGSDLFSDGSSPKHSLCMLEGIACRYKLLAAGRRQIMSLYLAGDFADTDVKIMDHAIGALTNCVVADVTHVHMQQMQSDFPNVRAALHEGALAETAMYRLWMLGIGRKSALGRFAHFLCEQFVRLKAVGLAEGQRAPLAVTQTEIADSLGLSLVHANRVLQELRSLGVVNLKSKMLTVLNWTELCRLGEFNADYLRFRKDASSRNIAGALELRPT